MSGACFFDGEGQLWDAEGVGFDRRAPTSCSDPALLRYLLEERGFIAFEEIGAALHARLVPLMVSPIALSAFCYHLADRNPERTAIAWLDGLVWRYGVFGSCKDAIRHVMSLIPLSIDRAGDFKSLPRSIDQLTPSTGLNALVRLWQQSCAPLHFDGLSQMLRDGLEGLYVVVQAVGDGTVYFRDVGLGYPWLEKQWVARARGLRVQDQPDYLLGSWVAQTYREVALNGVSRFEDIDAMTVTPRLGRSRIRYSRLVIPIQTCWGERCLLSAGMINASVNLRNTRSDA